MASGEGDGTDVDDAEDRAHRHHHRRRGSTRRGPDDGRAAVVRCRMHGRFGAALCDEREGADHQQDEARERSRLGEHRDGQSDGDHRPRDEAQFVHHRLERERRPQQWRAAVQLGPAGAHHRTDRGHAAGGDGHTRTAPSRASRTGRTASIAAMDVALIPDATGRTRDCPYRSTARDTTRGDERVRQREHRGEGTGQCVVAAQFGQHRDDADADHGDRYAAQRILRRRTLRSRGRRRSDDRYRARVEPHRSWPRLPARASIALMSVLVCFHAHPDDEVFTTGGVMRLAADAGHRVVVVTATDGALGEAPDGILTDGESLAERRRRELEESTSLLGAQRVVSAALRGFRDGGNAGEREPRRVLQRRRRGGRRPSGRDPRRGIRRRDRPSTTPTVATAIPIMSRSITSASGPPNWPVCRTSTRPP